MSNPRTSRLRSIALRLLAGALLLSLLAACGSGDGDDEVVAGAEPTTETEVPTVTEPEPTEPTQSVDTEPIIERWTIGPDLVDCVGVGPQTCMVIKRTPGGQSEWFYDSIEGFTHVEGTSYVVDVEITEIADPPADASSLRHVLVAIVEENSDARVPDLTAATWSFLGFADGQMFDRVPDGVEVSLAFDGSQLSGTAGCNRVMGTYIADATSIEFGPVAATKMLCPPEVMAVEDRFLQVLATVTTATVDVDGNLTLAPATGAALLFAPAG